MNITHLALQKVVSEKDSAWVRVVLVVKFHQGVRLQFQRLVDIGEIGQGHYLIPSSLLRWACSSALCSKIPKKHRMCEWRQLEDDLPMQGDKPITFNVKKETEVQLCNDWPSLVPLNHLQSIAWILGPLEIIVDRWMEAQLIFYFTSSAAD
jgi:hypothetical protein